MRAALREECGVHFGSVAVSFGLGAKPFVARVGECLPSTGWKSLDERPAVDVLLSAVSLANIYLDPVVVSLWRPRCTARATMPKDSRKADRTSKCQLPSRQKKNLLRADVAPSRRACHTSWDPNSP